MTDIRNRHKNIVGCLSMTNCELCGKKTAVYNTEIEGTTMLVCEDCAHFGKVKPKSNVKILVQDKKKPEIREPEFLIVQGYGAKVKNARERLGLKQEEMAKKLNERESLLHQIESEHFKPGSELARKLERELHIKIIEEIKDEDADMKEKPKRKQSGELTIGDMLSFNKK